MQLVEKGTVLRTLHWQLAFICAMDEGSLTDSDVPFRALFSMNSRARDNLWLSTFSACTQSELAACCRRPGTEGRTKDEDKQVPERRKEPVQDLVRLAIKTRFENNEIEFRKFLAQNLQATPFTNLG